MIPGTLCNRTGQLRQDQEQGGSFQVAQRGDREESGVAVSTLALSGGSGVSFCRAFPCVAFPQCPSLPACHSTWGLAVVLLFCPSTGAFQRRFSVT